MTRYRVLSPVDYNHTWYQIGSAINLDDATAGPLLAVKAIVLAEPSEQLLPAGERPLVALADETLRGPPAGSKVLRF